MKKLIFLFSLMITTLAFAQWDGNFPGQGSWQGDSIIVIDGDTLIVSTNPGNGNNPWDGTFPGNGSGGNWDGENPWSENDWGDDFLWGDDSLIVLNDSTIVIGGDTIVFSENDWNGENPWGNDNWDDEWDGEWPSDSMDCGGIPWWSEDFPCDENDWDWDEDSLDWDNDNWGDSGMIEDCNGEEAPENWVGDGYCDNGAWGADFNCEAFDFDGGDCEGWDENPWDNEDWDDEWGGNWPSDSLDCGDMPWWSEDFPCDENDWDWDEDSLDWDNEWPSDSMDCGDMPWWPEDFPCDENDWDWDEDSLDWDNDNWGDSGMIEDCNGEEAPENWIGDGYCDNGAWGADFNCEAFDFDGGDCEGIDEENPWDDNDWDNDFPWGEDSIDCEFPWDEEFPGGDWGEDNPENINFNEVFEIISSMELSENDVVLILEETDVDLSIFDADGFEFVPNEVEDYLVYGPFDLEELYSILIEEMEGLDIDWGLLRPMAMEMISEGTITSNTGNIADVFELVSMLSVDEMDADLEVYSTQYFDLAGREIVEPNNGVFIQVKRTNKGLISDKVFIKR